MFGLPKLLILQLSLMGKAVEVVSFKVRRSRQVVMNDYIERLRRIQYVKSSSLVRKINHFKWQGKRYTEGMDTGIIWE